MAGGGVSSEQAGIAPSLSPDLGLGMGMHEVGAGWMQSPLDFEWLTSAPFEMDFRGTYR
jgi:hypothetical protein